MKGKRDQNNNNNNNNNNNFIQVLQMTLRKEVIQKEVLLSTEIIVVLRNKADQCSWLLDL